MKPDAYKQKQSREWKKKNVSPVKPTPVEISPQREIAIENDEDYIINSFKSMLDNNSSEVFEFNHEKAANVVGSQFNLEALKELDFVDYVPAVQENVYYLPLCAGFVDKKPNGRDASNDIKEVGSNTKKDIKAKEIAIVPKSLRMKGKNAAAEDIDEWLDDL